MRTIILLLTLLIFPFVNHAQRDKKIVQVDNIQFLSFQYGQQAYLSDFGNNFNSLETYEAFQPVQSVGIQASTFEPSDGQYRLGSMLSYSQIIPQEVMINDTLNGTINGFNFGMTILQYNITPKTKWSIIAVGFGFNTGRMRMKSEEYRSQKNPYWAPALFLNPQFLIKQFVIGFSASYQFDVSRRGWRTLNISKKELDFELDEFRHTGLMANVSIGWKLK